MRILLIDIDSKIPNLALMKLSAYYKSIGDEVGFNIKNPNIIYASIIFKKNKYKIDGLNFLYPNSKIIVGGSGYDINVKLPNEIEFIKPDYDLYPTIKYSLGYSTRGCNRNCYFCIVPQKEGEFKYWQHPSEFYDERFNEIVFLDNNILFSKDRFREIIDFCYEKSLTVWFTQGLDIRLLEERDIQYLTKVKHRSIVFAWDNIKNPPESLIRQKLSILQNYNIGGGHNINVFVYINSDNEFESGLQRCKILKELGVNSFVMFNIDMPKTNRIRSLQHWANRRQLYWSIEPENYIKDLKNDKKQMRF